MTTLNEKQLIMSNLKKLENATETYRRINITGDYSLEERQAVEKKFIEAKNKTETEGGKLKEKANMYGRCVDHQKAG